MDAKGLVWKVDAGDVTDGASIPSIFLRITGPRFERHFLLAAVIPELPPNVARINFRADTSWLGDARGGGSVVRIRSDDREREAADTPRQEWA